MLQHLRQVREAAGLTQKEVAQRLGKPASYVNKCQLGERRMDLVEIRAFCRALDKPIGEFIREFDELLSASGL